MKKESDFKKCLNFLKINGWDYERDEEYMYGKYCQDELVDVALCNGEILIVDGHGTVISIPMNYFALVGVLSELRQIASNYLSAY